MPRDAEKVILVYHKDETKTDSEETKKALKEVIAPKDLGIQPRAIRKVQKGGVVVESGTRRGAQKIREIAGRVEKLKIAAPRKILPKILVYDLDRELTDEDIGEYMFKQNLVEAGVKRAELAEGFRICYRTGRRDLPVVNLVVEVSPKIREILLDAGRVYIDFAACRVVDHLSVTRCYRCQGYGHGVKFCKKPEGECVCSHCGKVGHYFRNCNVGGENPSCANCLAAKKPSDHRVGTSECPIYKRLVAQRVSMTQY